MEATKKQLIQFYTENFENTEGAHPTASEIDSFKKGELIDYIVSQGLESEFNKFLETLN